MSQGRILCLYLTMTAWGGYFKTYATIPSLTKQPFGYQMCSILCQKIEGCLTYTYVTSNLTCRIGWPNETCVRETGMHGITKKQTIQTRKGSESCPLNSFSMKTRTRDYRCLSYNRKRVLEESMKKANKNWTMSPAVIDHCHKLYKFCDEGDKDQAFKHLTRLFSKKLGELSTGRLSGYSTCKNYIYRNGCNLSKVIGNTTLLHWPIHTGYANLMQCLLSKNTIPIDTRGWKGRTDLMLAAETGNWELFALLQQRQWDLSDVDNKGSNILHFACRGGNSCIVKFLLNRVGKCALKERNNDGKTPIEMVGKDHTQHCGFFRRILDS